MRGPRRWRAEGSLAMMNIKASQINECGSQNYETHAGEGNDATAQGKGRIKKIPYRGGVSLRSRCRRACATMAVLALCSFGNVMA